MALDLSPYALTTVARLKTHLGRTTIAEGDVSDRAIAAINAATAWMERQTGRKLKARNWRTEFTVNLSSVVDDVFNPVLLDVTTPLLIKRGDDLIDLVNGYVPIGSQVSAYDEDNPGSTQVRITVGTTAALSVSPITFGSIPLVCDGTGDNVLDTPQWPLQELWAAYYVDASGTRTALSITSMRLHKAGGTIELPYDVFPEGEQNIELECRAGYEQPTTTVRGNVDEWNSLERLCLRISEVYYSDDLTQRGRMTDISMGGLSANVGTTDMPADILRDIRAFVRTR